MKKTITIAFADSMISRIKREDDQYIAEISLPTDGLYSGYTWELPLNEISFNEDNSEDAAYSFNQNKCWIKTDPDSLFIIKNHDGCLEDKKTLCAEEMKYRLKNSFNKSYSYHTIKELLRYSHLVN